MDPQAIIIWLIIGAVAGFLAGLIMRGGGYGILGNIIIGILGAVLASVIFPSLNISLGSGIVNEIAVATIGAIVLLFLLSLARRS
ncbi:MAG: GlsB/YeaQ/YmgE family stress response membrane protein [Hyphomicrobiales bacterium]|nr:GlsB/YeaQ/YmgE family stress response membrane protein [Hyphomicrobiales bacterium]